MDNAKTIDSSYLLSSEELQQSFKVYAGPGAGKTHFVCNNIKNIIEKNSKIKKYHSKKVLCITYTNSAVEVIKKRLVNLDSYLEVSTIHSFIDKYILHKHQDALKFIIKKYFGIEIGKNKHLHSQIEGMNLLHGHDRTDIYEYINKLCDTNLKLDYSKLTLAKVQIDIKKYSIDESIEINKPNSISQEHLYPIKQYIWCEANVMSHDEILILGYLILKEFPIILFSIRNMFPFVFIDEFQDTNPIQTMIVKLIGKEYSIIGVVGDICQSVYSFQGAKVSDFENFSLDNKKVNVYTIEQNRRSTNNIVMFANILRKDDNIKQVSVRKYDSEEQKKICENNKIKIIIKDSVKGNSEIKKIIKNGNVTILTRTWAGGFEYVGFNNDIQNELLTKIYSKYSYNKDLRNDILQFNTINWVRFFKFLFNVRDFLLTKSINSLKCALSLYFEQNVIHNLLKINKLLLLHDFFREIFKNANCNPAYYYYIIYDMLEQNKYLNLKEIFYINGEKTVNLFNELDKDDIKESIMQLNWKTADILFNTIFTNESKYMTIHGSKGLEWDNVLVDFKPSKMDGIKEQEIFNVSILGDKSNNEFIRLLYVGVTRARDNIYICIKKDLAESLKTKIEEFNNLNDFKIQYEIIG